MPYFLFLKNIFRWAAYRGDSDLFLKIIKERNLSPNVILDAEKNTALHYAANFNHVKLAQDISDLNVKGKKNALNWAPIHIATFYNYKKIVEILSKNKIE